MCLPSFCRNSISPSFPKPSTISINLSSITLRPSLQGTHFPHDSPTEKSVKNLAVSTIQVRSSIITTPPEPIMAPAWLSESKSISVSRISLISCGSNPSMESCTPFFKSHIFEINKIKFRLSVLLIFFISGFHIIFGGG